jgi:hypothetical protein
MIQLAVLIKRAEYNFEVITEKLPQSTLSQSVLTHRSSCICLLYTYDRFNSVRMRLNLKAEHRERFIQKQKFATSVMPTVKPYEEFNKLFPTENSWKD